MIVRYIRQYMYNSEYVTLTNVNWVRVTGIKIMIECIDGRKFELRHNLITNFEVVNHV